MGLAEPSPGDTTTLLKIAEAAQGSGPPLLTVEQSAVLGVVALGDVHGAILVAAERWTAERSLAVLNALNRGISTLTVSGEQLALLRRRLYG